MTGNNGPDAISMLATSVQQLFECSHVQCQPSCVVTNNGKRTGKNVKRPLNHHTPHLNSIAQPKGFLVPLHRLLQARLSFFAGLSRFLQLPLGSLDTVRGQDLCLHCRDLLLLLLRSALLLLLSA